MTAVGEVVTAKEPSNVQTRVGCYTAGQGAGGGGSLGVGVL